MGSRGVDLPAIASKLGAIKDSAVIAESDAVSHTDIPAFLKAEREEAEVYISSHVATFVATRFFFFHAEIFKSGYFMQIYSNQSVLCRNIGQVPLRVTQSCAADYLDRTWMQCLFFFRFH